ncbi:MAG: hypothetical protein ACON4W_02910 [Parvibaculales bacterium]
MRNMKLIFAFSSILIVGAVTANAAFKSSSTGSGVSKPAPPAVCVGDPGTNQPCVITDDSVAFGKVADLKAKVAAGTATKADFEALGITISASVDLDDSDTIAYLNAKVNAIITSGNLTNSKKPADLKSTIDTATTANVALWTIYKTASGASGYPTSGLTSALLTNAGVSSTILSDTDTTIGTLQSNITTSGLSSSLTSTDVENWVVDTAGFSSSTTYAQVQTATTNGWSIANFKAASNNGYTESSGDNTLYGEALTSTYTAACQAEDSSATSCTDLSKTQFQAAKSYSALLVTKKAKVTAGTLTLADLTALGLTTTTLGASPASWELEYLMSQLGTGDSVSKGDWQTTINAFSSQTAAKWKLAQIASGSSDHPTSDLTVTLAETAGGTSGAVANVGATIAQLRSGITTSGLTASSTDAAINNWFAVAAGFPSGTTYADVNTAITNGWTAANYELALTAGGWTNTAAQSTAFGNCKTSATTSTGGAGSCTVSSSSWTAISTAIAAAADSDTDLTAANVTSILSATSTTANSYLDTSNTIHMDYLNQCISGESSPADALSTCASSSNLKKNVKAYQVGMIASLNSGSYTKSSITTTLLKQIGVPDNSANVIGSNNCGTGGNSSCLTALRDAIVSSDLDETATPTNVTNKINELMRAQMVIVANNTSIPAASGTLKSGCSTSYNLPLPDPCGHSQWTCTKVQGPSGWNISGTNVVVPSSSTATGNQNVKIRMSLGIYSPAYTKDVTRTYNIAQAVAASANGYKKFSTSGNNPWGPWNSCIAKGGNLATYSNVNGTYSLDSHMWFAPSTEQSPSTLCCSSKNYKAWVSESEITCRKSGTNGQSKRGGYGNQWWHCNPSQSSYVKTYWCKNLPSC